MRTILDELNVLADDLTAQAVDSEAGPDRDGWLAKVGLVERVQRVLIDLMTPCVVDSPIAQPGAERIEIDDRTLPGSVRVNP